MRQSPPKAKKAGMISKRLLIRSLPTHRSIIQRSRVFYVWEHGIVLYSRTTGLPKGTEITSLTVERRENTPI